MLIDHKQVHNVSLVTQHLFTVIKFVCNQIRMQHRIRLSFGRIHSTMRVTADVDRDYWLSVIIKYCSPLLGKDLETNNETTSAARKQILNKQVYAAVT
jgi:hypothetical protein